MSSAFLKEIDDTLAIDLILWWLVAFWLSAIAARTILVSESVLAAHNESTHPKRMLLNIAATAISQLALLAWGFVCLKWYYVLIAIAFIVLTPPLIIHPHNVAFFYEHQKKINWAAIVATGVCYFYFAI